jgi:hypothetical protein
MYHYGTLSITLYSFLDLILRHMDLYGTETPVLETQYMMSMVLVIGSEGISFTLGYFIN